MVNIWVNDSSYEVGKILNINASVSTENVLAAMQDNGLDEVLIMGHSGNRYLAYGTGIDTDEFAGAEVSAPTCRISGDVLAVDNEVNTGWEGFKDGWVGPVAAVVGGGAVAGAGYFGVVAGSLGAGAAGVSTVGGVSISTILAVSTYGVIAGAILVLGGVVYGGCKVYQGKNPEFNEASLLALGQPLEEVDEEDPAREGGGCSASPAEPSMTGRAVDNALKDALSEYRYALRQIGIL